MTQPDREARRLQAITRRHFFGECAVGVGAIALNAMLRDEGWGANIDPADPLAPRQPHHPAKA